MYPSRSSADGERCVGKTPEGRVEGTLGDVRVCAGTELAEAGGAETGCISAVNATSTSESHIVVSDASNPCPEGGEWKDGGVHDFACRS